MSSSIVLIQPPSPSSGSFMDKECRPYSRVNHLQELLLSIWCNCPASRLGQANPQERSEIVAFEARCSDPVWPPVASIPGGIIMARLFLASLLLLFALGGNQIGSNWEPVDNWQMNQVERLREEAEQGSTEAQFQLGIAYFLGETIDQDFDHCAFWISKAAFSGHPYAQGFLGAMHTDGLGVPQNDMEAYVWYSVAAANGNEYADESLERLARRLTPITFCAAQVRAKHLNSRIKDGVRRGNPNGNPGPSRPPVRSCPSIPFNQMPGLRLRADQPNPVLSPPLT